MNVKLREELAKRVQPFLPKIRQSNAPRPTLNDIITGDNLKYIDFDMLKDKFDLEHDSINFRLEGAMDQLDFILDEMSDMAELEMIHDYPEIAKIMSALHDYKRSPKTADSMKKLYNLTRYLNLPARTLEIETPKEVNIKLFDDPAHKTFQPRLEYAFLVFLDIEEKIFNKLKAENELNEKTLKENLELEKKLENEKQLQIKKENELKNNKPKNHPFLIKNKLTYTPFD